jgi:2-methylthioadenine synthetase
LGTFPVGRAYVETYGCWLAKADAEVIRQRLGYEEVSTAEEADLVLVYTCAVREDGEVRQLARIRELATLARDGRRRCLVSLAVHVKTARLAPVALPRGVEGGRGEGR